MTHRSVPLDPETLLAHGDFVRRVARSLLYDEHAAEDVVQQTWLAALGSQAKVSRSWLGAVARNLAVKRIRGDVRRIARERLASRPEGAPSNHDVLERERLRRSVVDAVLALREPYRGTILLRYLDTQPPREVARRMGVPVETVRTRTRRGLEILRRSLDARHASERVVFSVALGSWAGPRPSRGAQVALEGAAIMGKKTVVVVVCAIVLGLASMFLLPDDAPPAQDTGAPGAGTAPRESATRERRPAPPTDDDVAVTATPPVQPFIRGRVVDEAGSPAAGMSVIVMGDGVLDPDAAGEVKSNMIRLTTDEGGRFETTVGSRRPCSVIPMAGPEFQPGRGVRRDVEPPADDIDFVVTRHPVATLLVTAHDYETGAAFERFSCEISRDAGRAARWSTADGQVTALVRLAAAAGATVHVIVRAGDATAERDIALGSGDRVAVRIDIGRDDGGVAGRVTDAAGAPLTGAIVFFGEEDVARGDEPFKPFDERRVRDRMRSDAEGRFVLSGSGRWITVWHPSASPVTVPAEKASEIVLAPRGTISGTLHAPDGSPLPATDIYLDRVRKTTTDVRGAFTFDAVEAGTRGLSLEPRAKAYFAVRVVGGETADVELRPGLAEVRIEWPGRTEFGRFVGLVPLDDVGSLVVARSVDGELVARSVLPGRYLFLGEKGLVATGTIDGGRTTARVGDGVIVVHTEPKTRVYVVPAGVGYLARLLAGRMATVTAADDGVARFHGLAPGRYDVGIERDGVWKTVEVGDGEVETSLE